MKTYEISCRLSDEAAIERIKALLIQEGVKFRTGELTVFSTRTPIAVLGIQPSLYSRRNWVGLNPFTYVTAVNVQCLSVEDDVTKIIVHIDQFRAFVWVMFWTCCFGFASLGMPGPADAALFVA